MGRKYIKQRTSSNFVYPNNSLEEYDINIVHDINNNSVSGTTTTISGSSVSSSGITFSFNYTWAQNGAELFSTGTGTPTCPSYSVASLSSSSAIINWIDCSNNAETYLLPPFSPLIIPSAKIGSVFCLSDPSICNDVMISQIAQQYGILSVHMMEPNTTYYKPWRLVHTVTSTSGTTKSGTVTFTVTPSQMGISSFTNGVYTFEIRMIGKRAIYPICQSVTVTSVPAPSPTPTRTPQATPTPTPTTPPAVSYTSGATINVTDTGYIRYTAQTGQTYQFINTLGNVVLSECLICSSIIPGIPFADVAAFTIVNCGTTCGGPAPSPTPTPSGGQCYSTEWKIDNSSSPYDVYWGGTDCYGGTMGGTVGAYSIGYTGCVKDGTLTYTGFPIISNAGYC